MNIFITAGIISFVFLIVKFVEMRMIEKESKALKYLIRDALLVYFSIIIGFFIIDQVKPMIQNSETIISSPNVFTDGPGF
jgi:hypothetical protein